jgi:adenylate cyclase
MTDSARELARMDRLLRQYAGPHLADRLDADPDLAQLGGREQVVSVLFADLAGFTTFADGRPATEVIQMLTAYWGAVVPSVVEREGGLIERFAGDAILAVFNALGDHPDHAARAVRAAVGNVGAGTQRSFAVIGDTTNVAARLQGLSTPGQITLASRTVDAARSEPGVVIDVRPLGPTDLRGMAAPTEAYELLSVIPAREA